MTILDTHLDEMTHFDLDAPVPCFAEGCDVEAIVRAIHRPCNHMHTLCHHHAAEMRWKEKQYPGTTFYHVCCGQAIERTDWRSL